MNSAPLPNPLYHPCHVRSSSTRPTREREFWKTLNNATAVKAVALDYGTHFHWQDVPSLDHEFEFKSAMPNRRNRSTPIPNGAPLLNQQLETELTELLDRRLPPTQSRSDLIVDLIRSSWTTVPNRTRDKNEANAARIAVLAHLLDQEDPKASSALRAELGHHYVTTTKQKWAAFAEIERIAVRIYDAWDMWPWQLVERNPPTFGIGLLKQLHNLVSTKCPVGTLQHLLNAAIDERQLVRISGVPGANYLIPRDAVEAKTAFHRQQRTSGSSTVSISNSISGFSVR